MLVLDTLFVDSLVFKLSDREIIEMGPSRSLEEHWKKCCAAVGIELIEYAYVQDRYDPWLNLHHIELLSQQWATKR